MLHLINKIHKRHDHIGRVNISWQRERQSEYKMKESWTIVLKILFRQNIKPVKLTFRSSFAATTFRRRCLAWSEWNGDRPCLILDFRVEGNLNNAKSERKVFSIFVRPNKYIGYLNRDVVGASPESLEVDSLILPGLCVFPEDLAPTRHPNKHHVAVP